MDRLLRNRSWISLIILGFFTLGSTYNLPAPTEMVPLSRAGSHPALKGVKIDPNDPFKLEFILDTKGQKNISEEETARLVNYFLAALTIPEKDLWVNLSPQEKERVTSNNLALTDMGKDMLSEDYILKQLVSTLTYPEDKIGKKYWDSVYEKVHKIAGITNIPINTFNKVWVVPKNATVVEEGNVALITDASLAVLHEEDYLAINKRGMKDEGRETNEKINKVGSSTLKEMVLPEIERDVNYGENFAKLRQMYNSFILATWFKKKLKNSIYQYYIDQGKVEGIDLAEKDAKDKIFNLYVEAYKKGVYNYVKKDFDPHVGRSINRRYYSGGLQWDSSNVRIAKNTGQLARNAARDDLQSLTVNLASSSLTAEQFVKQLNEHFKSKKINSREDSGWDSESGPDVQTLTMSPNQRLILNYIGHESPDITIGDAKNIIAIASFQKDGTWYPAAATVTSVEEYPLGLIRFHFKNIPDGDYTVRFITKDAYGWMMGEDTPSASSAAADPIGGIAFSDDGLIKADGEIKYNWSPRFVSEFQNLSGLRVQSIQRGGNLRVFFNLR